MYVINLDVRYSSRYNRDIASKIREPLSEFILSGYHNTINLAAADAVLLKIAVLTKF